MWNIVWHPKISITSTMKVPWWLNSLFNYAAASTADKNEHGSYVHYIPQ
jgi:hypothetical protein